MRTTVLTRSEPDAATRARIDGARLVIADAADAEQLRTALGEAGHVAWCAGGLLPAESNERPIDDVVGTLAPLLVALQALADRGWGHLTLISSGGTVYGNPTVLPVPEHAVLRPLTSHGITRLAAEHYVSLFADVHGVAGLSLRCANVFGAGQRPGRSQGVVAATFARLRDGAHIPVFGDGTSVRDYIHVDDVVDALMALWDLPTTPGVVNVGSGVGTSLSDLLALMEEVSGVAVRVDRHPARPGDVRGIVLDTTLLRSLIPFEPRPLRDGLARTWAAGS